MFISCLCALFRCSPGRWWGCCADAAVLTALCLPSVLSTTWDFLVCWFYPVFKSQFSKLYFICIYVYFIFAYVHLSANACGGWKKAFDFLEPELPAAMSYLTSAWNQMLGL